MSCLLVVGINHLTCSLCPDLIDCNKTVFLLVDNNDERKPNIPVALILLDGNKTLYLLVNNNNKIILLANL